MAYDDTEKAVVITGGAAFANQQLSILGDFWKWDGSNWSPVNGNGVAAMGLSMAYDTKRNRLLTFGGYNSSAIGDLKALSHGMWYTIGSLPDYAQTDAGMVYDLDRDRVVLLLSKNDQYVRTLEFDGHQFKPGGSGVPTGVGGAMSYDPATRNIVLFGGSLNKQLLDQTWIYDGVRWQSLSVRGPSARAYPAMAYDDKSATVILFGGMGADYKFLGDTWSWDGKSWSLLDSHGPALECRIAYDKLRDKLVLFGSSTHMEAVVSQTWEWDGKAWIQKL